MFELSWTGHPPSVSIGMVSPTESRQPPSVAKSSMVPEVDVWGNTFLNATKSSLVGPSHTVEWGGKTKKNDFKPSSLATSQRQQQQQQQRKLQSKQQQQQSTDDQVHSLFDQLLTYSSSSGDEIPRIPNRVRDSSSSRRKQDVKKGSYWNIESELLYGMQLP